MQPVNTDPGSAADQPNSPMARALPQGLVCLLDHEQHAQTQLPEAVWAYFNGGAAEEVTLRANAKEWQRLN